MATKFEWVVSAQQRKAWQTQFVTLVEESGQGAVTGEQLKTLLSGSGLQTTTLAQIWALSAKAGSKTLNEEEFMICCFLVGAAVRGVAIPSTLPKELLKSIRKPSKEVSAAVTPPSASPPPAASSPPVTRIKSGKLRGEHSPDRPKRSASGTLRSSGGGSHSGSSASISGGADPNGAQVTTVAGASASPGSTKRKSKWALSKEQKRRFIETFSSWSTEGFVDGETAVRLFSQSGLPRPDLASIWALSDMDRDTKLSQQEFCVAMALISRRMQGDALPSTVPTALVLSASSDLMSKKGSKGLSRTGQSSGMTRGAKEATQGGAPQRSISMMGPTTASGAPSQRASIMVIPSSGSGGGSIGLTSDESSGRGLQRSSSSAMHSSVSVTSAGMDVPSNSMGGGFSAVSQQGDMFAARQPLQIRSASSASLGGSGFGSMTSYSASDLPTHELSSYGGMRPIAMYGVDERPIPSYDATSDLVKLEEVNDLATMQMLLSRLAEEVRTISTAYDKSQLQHETLKVKLDATLEQASITQRRRNNFDTILRNYNQQLDADMSMYNSLKTELNEASTEIESLQQQLNSPQFDLTALRERRRVVQSEFSKVRAQASASHEEHTRLVLEVEKLRAAGTEQASQINTDWSDHGFKEEPAVAFGDGDFASSASTSALPSSAAFSPSFTFKPTTAPFGTASGTMTPSIDDWDFNDAASEVGEEVDLAWLKPDFSSPTTANTATTNGSDFFAAESTNWANFSVQEDERRRERANSVAKERKSHKTKSEAKSPSDPEKKKKKSKKEK